MAMPRAVKGLENASRAIDSDIPHRRPRRRPATYSMAVNLAPMIDVTFLLLIFFLVTTTFERAEGILAANLPKDAGRPAPALPITPIVVRLSPAGAAGDGVSIAIERFENAPQSFVALFEFLRSVHAKPGFDQETPVVIRAADDVRWDHVVGCWNAAIRAGSKKIAFAGD